MNYRKNVLTIVVMLLVMFGTLQVMNDYQHNILQRMIRTSI